MDVGGLQVERGPAADRVPVERVAVGGRHEPGLLARGRVVAPGQRLEAAGGPPGRRPRATTSRTRSRSASLATFDIAGTMASSSGIACVRRQLLDRPVGDDPGGRPARAQAVGHDVDVGVDVRPVRADAAPATRRGARACRPAGTGPTWASSVCGPLIWSTTEQLVERQVVGLDRRLRDDLEDVAGDPVLVGEAVRRDRRGLAPHPLHQPPRLGAARGPGVVEPVAVALVAVDGRGGRRQAEDRPPSSGRRSGRSRTARGQLSVTVAGTPIRTGAPGRSPGGSRRRACRPVNIARASRAGQPPNNASWSPVRSTAGSSPRMPSMSARPTSSCAGPRRGGGWP